MAWWQCLVLGALGGVLAEVLGVLKWVTVWQSARRGTSGRLRGKPPSFRTYVDVPVHAWLLVIRMLLGAGTAWLFGVTGQVSGPYAALAFGFAAPAVLAQLGASVKNRNSSSLPISVNLRSASNSPSANTCVAKQRLQPGDLQVRSLTSHIRPKFGEYYGYPHPAAINRRLLPTKETSSDAIYLPLPGHPQPVSVHADWPGWHRHGRPNSVTHRHQSPAVPRRRWSSEKDSLRLHLPRRAIQRRRR